MKINPLFTEKAVIKGIAMGILVVSMTSCGQKDALKEIDSYNLPYSNILECKELTDIDKGICVEEHIKEIQNKYIRNCAVGNIAEKVNLSKRLSNNNITNKDIDDIDGLIKECNYYMISNNISSSTDKNTAYPIFSHFLTSAAGSFVGNYLGNTAFNSFYNTNGRYNCSNKEKKDCRDSYNYFLHSFSPSSNSYTSNDKNSGGSGKLESINKVEKKSKADSWKVKEMKASSKFNNNNYKLGNTSKSWSTISESAKKNSTWANKKSLNDSKLGRTKVSNKGSSRSGRSGSFSSGRSGGFGG